MEMIFSTEDEQYAYEQEKNLWEQEPAKIMPYTFQVPAVTPSPFAELTSLLGKSKSSVIERIEAFQQTNQKVPFSISCPFEELCKIIGISQTEVFKEDYKLWKGVVYTKEQQKSQTEGKQKGKAGVMDFLEEIKSIEQKKEAQQLPKQEETKTTIDVEFEGSSEKTKNLEEWLDDILS